MAITIERIEIDPAVMVGKRVVRGKRITVELIFRKVPRARARVSCSKTTRTCMGDMRAAVGAVSVAQEEVVLFSDTRVAARS